MKNVSSVVLLALATFSCQQVKVDNNHQQPTKQIKNIIMVVADGMGPAYTSAYRYYNDDPNTPTIEQTVFDRHLVGSASTYPAPISGYITDSAAAATALATGVKTYNDAIGVDVNKKPVETVLEWAKLQGKKTGIVVTSQIIHATPASYLAHNESRRNYNAIADSYIDNGVKADVYLGGGWKYFIRKDRNLVDEFKANGFHYVDDYNSLNTIPENTPVFGLFGKKGLPWALDDKDSNRLSTMTKAALPLLENDNGYFMLIEASQIDWGGHGRDIAAAMAEVDDLAKTLEYLESYVVKNPNTLVVVTADHSTGGLSIGRKTAKLDKSIRSSYLWQPQILRTMKNSPESIAKKLTNELLTIEQASELLNFKLTEPELTLLKAAKLKGKEIIKQFNLLSKAEKKGKWAPAKHDALLTAIKKIIDVRTNTGWGSISDSGTHTGIDVPVFAFGKQKQLFAGSIDNTDIAKNIFKLLGKK